MLFWPPEAKNDPSQKTQKILILKIIDKKIQAVCYAPPVKFSQKSYYIVTFLVILSLFGMDQKSPNYLIWWLFSCRLTIQKQ